MALDSNTPNDLKQAVLARHSVRQYKNKPLTEDVCKELRRLIAIANDKGGLHFQLVTDEPKAFSSPIARYGRFRGVTNYIALVGPDDSSLDEKLGYFGEYIVLHAQAMGLNTCWVGVSYSKTADAFYVGQGEKLRGVIAIGYGETQGTSHHIKEPADVADFSGREPDWFKKGVRMALLAPTAMNQQRFKFFWKGDDKVCGKSGFGMYTRMDLGIAECHFEIGAERDIQWQK